jgi:hypothetical protein
MVQICGVVYVTDKICNCGVYGCEEKPFLMIQVGGGSNNNSATNTIRVCKEHAIVIYEDLDFFLDCKLDG